MATSCTYARGGFFIARRLGGAGLLGRLVKASAISKASGLGAKFADKACKHRGKRIQTARNFRKTLIQIGRTANLDLQRVNPTRRSRVPIEDIAP